MYCSIQHLHDIKYITFLEVHFKISLTLYLRLVAKQPNSAEATTKLVQMLSDGEISSLKFLPLL